LKTFCDGVDFRSTTLNFAFQEKRPVQGPDPTYLLSPENISTKDYIHIDSFVKHPKEIVHNKTVHSIFSTLFDNDNSAYLENYINGIFYEFGMVHTKNLTKAKEYFEKGLTANCHECAKRLISYYIEPIELNSLQPHMEFEKAIAIFSTIFQRNGFIQILTIKRNYMPLLHLYYIYLDLFQDFREIVQKICEHVSLNLAEAYDHDNCIENENRIKALTQNILMDRSGTL
jgi:hypothetical protein